MGLKDFGKSDNEKGQWFPFGDDVTFETSPFDVRIRRVPNDKVKEFSARTGKEVMLTIDGLRRPTTERTQEQWTEFLLSQSAWAWSDVRQRREDGSYGDLTIEVADEAAAGLWKNLLKLSETPAVGSDVSISGALLTDAVKRRIMLQVRPFATLTAKDDETGLVKSQKVDLSTFLIVKSALLQQDEIEASRAAEGN